MTSGKVVSFKGIPYAQPPFGANRLCAPVPFGPWTGTRDATAFGPRPPQPASPLLGTPAWTAEEGSCCLTVNVWTPESRDGGLPVMVWIYGGAYLRGSASDAGYDGESFAAGGVVFVSLNYRGGFEGFADVPGAPPNRGVLDQVAALTWVRENIAAFGGDPDNVTVFGESAGAGSVTALLAMPSARGLFRRAIVQSVPGNALDPDTARRVTAAVAARLDVGATVGELAEVDPERAVAAVEAVTRDIAEHRADWGSLAYTTTPFALVVDGDVLPTDPVAAPVSRGTDLVVGFTRDEYRLFVVPTGGLDQIHHADVAAAVRVFGLPESAVDAYRAARPQAGAGDLYAAVVGDWLFRMPSLRLAERYARGGGRTYCYEFTWVAPVFGGRLGACHGLELPFVFGVLDRLSPTMRALLGPRPPAGLARAMNGSWTAFAATGDPGWPAFSDTARRAMCFGESPHEVSDPAAVERAIWAPTWSG